MILTICLNPVLQKTLCFSSTLEKSCVNRVLAHRLDASGKGINVSRVLTQLNEKVLHITQLGGDFYTVFKKLCKEDGIILKCVKTKSSIRFCYTVIDSEVTELVEEGYYAGREEEKHIMRNIESVLKRKKINAVVLSGTKAPGFSDTVYPEIVCECLFRGIPVIADYRGKDLVNTLDAVKNCKNAPLLTIKPNISELCSTFSCETTEKGAVEQIEYITKVYGCSCIITQGEKPVLVRTSDGFRRYEIIKARTVQNTTGCGDAFTAGFASVISRGGNCNEAVLKGLECGAKNAETIRPGSIY